MDSLFLLQFACFIFMLVNALFVALSHLHVRWENKRYERSRWMIVIALIGLAIQYVIQMGFGFRAADIREGLYIMLALFCVSVIYCISMIVREMIRRRNLLETMAATDILHLLSHNKIYYRLTINELSITKNVTANDLETSYILFLSQLCNIQRMLRL